MRVQGEEESEEEDDAEAEASWKRSKKVTAYTPRPQAIPP